MNRQQILSRLGAKYAIVYSTGPLSLWDRSSEAWQSAPVFPTTMSCAGVLLDVPGKFPFRWPRVPAIDYVTIRLAAIRWNRLLRQLSDSSDRCVKVAYVFHPSFWPFIRHLNIDRLIYHAYDQYSKTPGWAEELQQYEINILSRADVVFASSRITAEYLEKLGQRPVHFLPNGVDYEHFSSPGKNVPADLANVPEPRAGYVGRISRKVDVRLIVRLANRRPNVHFVIIGPVVDLDASAEDSIAEAKELKNIYFLGPKHADELPDYLAHLDVGLLCYKIDDGLWTTSIYPLKLHEYLASGLPVVSADIPSVRDYPNVVWIATDEESWLEKIDKSIAGCGPGDVAMRMKVASENTWDKRVSFIESHFGSTAEPNSDS
jgi:glycosyltransferase involved in cell wall biosynthesis